MVITLLNYSVKYRLFCGHEVDFSVDLDHLMPDFSGNTTRVIWHQNEKLSNLMFEEIDACFVNSDMLANFFVTRQERTQDVHIILGNSGIYNNLDFLVGKLTGTKLEEQSRLQPNQSNCAILVINIGLKIFEVSYQAQLTFSAIVIWQGEYLIIWMTS